MHTLTKRNVGRNINRDHIQSIRDGHSQAHPHTQYELDVFLIVVYHSNDDSCIGNHYGAAVDGDKFVIFKVVGFHLSFAFYGSHHT